MKTDFKIYGMRSVLEEYCPQIKWEIRDTVSISSSKKPFTERFQQAQLLGHKLEVWVFARNNGSLVTDDWELIARLYFPAQEKEVILKEDPFPKGQEYLDRVKILLDNIFREFYSQAEGLYLKLMDKPRDSEANAWFQDLEAIWRLLSVMKGLKNE